jgi:hypothetical protein
MRPAPVPMALFAAIPLLWSASASAQDLMMGGITQSWTSTQMLLNSEKQAWAAPECIDERRWAPSCGPRPSRRAAPDTARAATADGIAAAPAIRPEQFRFTPSPAARQRNFASFINKVRSADPAGAQQLQAELTGQDIIGLIGQRVAPYGLSTTNVADAMAIYVMEAWEAVAGRTLPPSRERAQALKHQMERAAASTGTLEGASNATKQELAEAMLVQAAMISSMAETARGSGGEQARAVSDAVAKGAQATLGIDLRRMTLTEQGLVENQTGAADSDAQVRPGTAEPASGGISGYAALAAAGTMGLGAAYLIGRSRGRKG